MPLKDRLTFDADPLYLVDGSSFLYRGFYAYPDLKRSDGFPTNAIFIVLRILMRILREEKPKYLSFLLDGKGPTFRHELYPEYKAQRPRMPEPLAEQIEPLKEAIGLMGIPLMVSEGVEADDCIASLANTHKTARPVVIVGSDKDLKQCLDERVFMWDPAGKREKVTTLDDFREENAIEPVNWPDFQALMGDSSDNIPGIPGVGPKTAQKIMDGRHTLEEVRDQLGDLPDKLRDKITPHMDDVFLYRKLTRLRTDACQGPVDEYAVRDMNVKGLAHFLDTYEFRSLGRELASMARMAGQQPPATPATVKSKTRKKDATQAQFSLLGEPEKPGEPLAVTRVPAPADLPDLSGKPVGLVLSEGGIFLGLEGVEYRFLGQAAELIEALSAAKTVAVPNLHDLLRADPAWEQVGLATFYDLALAAYLLDPEQRGYGWDRLRQALFTDGFGSDIRANAEPVHPDAQGLAALAYMEAVAPRIESAGLDKLMRDLETPLTPVLASMERAGVHIDLDKFNGFLNEVSGEADDAEKRIHEHAGHEFNVRSSQQMAGVLFDELDLKPAGKTPGGALSTANQVLEKLKGAHPIIDDILTFRMLEKLRSTYLAPLPKLVDATGRIHSSFNQLATATGRLSSSGPNLQNIPIRGPQGKRMRACFDAGPGNMLASADYSQVELRVLAHFSKDPTLVEAFKNDEDIHARTAAILFDRDAPGAVTREERDNAKTINFGLIYGMGPQRLARELSMTMNEAKAFIERYFERLSTLKAFYESVVNEAIQSGYVTTLAGRRRLLPELHSRNQQLVSQARRQAVNTVIQGSAADVIKLAMLAVARDEKLKDMEAKLILQIHDELVLETPAGKEVAASERLAEVMGTVTTLDVPLKVDAGHGANWAEAH